MRRLRVGYDRYNLPRKLREPTRCRECGVLYREGRWVWAPRSVQLSGEYFEGHRAQILRRVRRCEETEMAEHPLERIIAITPAPDGELDSRYSKGEKVVRVHWSR